MKSDPNKRVIIVFNEEESSLQLILEPLKWEGYNVKGFTSPELFTQAVINYSPHMIIIDPEIGKADQLEFANEFLQTQDSCCAIITSKHSSTEKITQFLDLGASDFISLPFVPLEFLARIRNQFRILDMRTQLFDANKKLQALVEIDDLTGLFNMRSTFQKLDFEIERSKRYGRPLAVVMIDMDHFKSVNDGHDHLFGSYVISEMGKIIRSCTRTVDIPARYGGDEFLIVLSEAPDSGVEFFCERLRKKVESTIFNQGIDTINLTLSIGYSLLDLNQEMNSKELVRQADMALYEAKRRGRNCVKSYKKEIDRIYHDIDQSINKTADFTKKRKTAA